MSAHALSTSSMPCGDGSSAAFSLRSLWRALVRRIAGPGAEVLGMKLDAGQVVRLTDAAGWTVVCASGAVWITQETDIRDIFLKHGEGFALDRGGLTLVRACRPSMLSIRAPAARRLISSLQSAVRSTDANSAPVGNSADLAWPRSLYPECGPWNGPASYRRAGLL